MYIFFPIFSFVLFISTANALFSWFEGQSSAPYDLVQLINYLEPYSDNLTKVEHPKPNFRHRRLEPLHILVCKHLGCNYTQIETKFPPQTTNSIDTIVSRKKIKEKNDHENRKVYDADQIHEYILRTNDYAAVDKPSSFLREKVSNDQPISAWQEKNLKTNEMHGMGTEKAVKEIHNTTSKTSEENKFKADYQKILQDIVCEFPTPTIVRVADHYPDKSKTYLPPSIKLYKCSRLSGCCSDDSECVARTTQTINLHFKVTYVESENKESIIQKLVSYETLSFNNDTSCKCSAEYADVEEITTEERPYEEHDRYFNKINSRECKCARPFNPSLSAKGKCVCDCSNQDDDCYKYKRGLGIFGDEARRCLTGKKCTPPQCEYGDYVAFLGRCPLKPNYIASLKPR